MSFHYIRRGKLLSTISRAELQFLSSVVKVQTRSKSTSTLENVSVVPKAGVKFHGTWLLLPAAVAVALGYGKSQSLSEKFHEDAENMSLGEKTHNDLAVDWLQELAARKDSQLVLSAETKSHPLLKKDHMFSELHRHGLVRDMVCFYSKPEQCLSYVIQLGENVCGFPKIMHGGLTAAIIDESFGFLWLSLRANKQLPFVGPAFTAHLEVDYKQKIPAGQLLLCKTEVLSCEGRKLWMKATVYDRPDGKVYATARALFIRPRTQKLLQDSFKIAYNYLTS